MTKKSLSQLQAEAEKAEKALQKARSEAQEAIAAEEERIQKEAAEVVEKAAFAAKVLLVAPIVDALAERGYDIYLSETAGFQNLPYFVWTSSDNRVHTMKIQTYYKENYSFRRGVALLKITVGGYSDAVHYRLRKDGTFNAKAIAKKFDEKCQAGLRLAKQTAKQEATRNASKVIVHRLCALYGEVEHETKSKWSDKVFNANVREYTHNPGLVEIGFPYKTKAVTEERAIEFIELVQRWAAEDKAAKKESK